MFKVLILQLIAQRLQLDCHAAGMSNVYFAYNLIA